MGMARRFDFAPVRWVNGRWALSPRLPPAPAAAARIASWNVWFDDHQAAERHRALLAELHRRDVDVIALQEVTQQLLDTLLAERWIRSDYQVSELQVIGYDVVILSRLPISRVATILLPSAMGRRLIVAELACGLEVATTHLESTAPMAAVRAEQLAIVFDYLGTRADSVLVGDMNFDPDAPAENAALDARFVDVWPALRPDDPGYTIDSIRNPMRLAPTAVPRQQRIDRVFARTARWTPRRIDLLGTDPIDDQQTFVSDHFGLEVELAVDR
jgi:tyrosyl-DNA phosphodiesterase 2